MLEHLALRTIVIERMRRAARDVRCVTVDVSPGGGATWFILGVLVTENMVARREFCQGPWQRTERRPD
ncbi:MAG TPA: hypothetical protein VMM27_11560 [Casimicrobiaceae bacterium]|nr:hypothetical protein [Casimicrobiaceae bacterium]